jgi:hypothetical protein
MLWTATPAGFRWSGVSLVLVLIASVLVGFAALLFAGVLVASADYCNVDGTPNPSPTPPLTPNGQAVVCAEVVDVAGPGRDVFSTVEDAVVVVGVLGIGVGGVLVGRSITRR